MRNVCWAKSPYNQRKSGTSWATVPNTTAYRLRPVAVVTVAKE